MLVTAARQLNWASFGHRTSVNDQLCGFCVFVGKYLIALPRLLKPRDYLFFQPLYNSVKIRGYQTGPSYQTAINISLSEYFSGIASLYTTTI